MKKILLTILIVISAIPTISRAEDYKLIEPLPCIEGTANKCEGGVVKGINLKDYINYVFKFSIALAAFLAVVMIIWGGFEYITSETPFGKGNGKDRIQNAIFGLIMVLASYLILQTIDPRLVEVYSEIPAVNTKVYSEANAAIDAYQKKLASDLQNLSIEKQKDIENISKSIDSLKAEKTALEQKYKAGGMDEEEYGIQKGTLDATIGKLTANKVSKIADAQGLTNFQMAYFLANNPDVQSTKDLGDYIEGEVPNTLTDGKYPINSKNKIQNEYNAQINYLLQISPRTQDVANSIYDLSKQRDFYISQAKEETDLSIKIRQGVYSRRASTGAGDQNTTIDNTKYFENKLKESEMNLADFKVNATKSGLSVEQYSNIMKTRADRITKILEASNKK